MLINVEIIKKIKKKNFYFMLIYVKIIKKKTFLRTDGQTDNPKL